MLTTYDDVAVNMRNRYRRLMQSHSPANNKLWEWAKAMWWPNDRR